MPRLGVVSFLNSRPLIEGLGGGDGVELLFDVPALLPGRLERGEVDAALVPIIDVLRSAGRYRVVSDACIGCDGETMTVRVFSQAPPDRIRRLWVDPDSHTSVALAAVLWRELFQTELVLQPFDPRTQRPDDYEAVLLIGDKVVDPGRGHWAYEVDLGGAWRQQTGLPFVFAVWATMGESPGANNEFRIANNESAAAAPTVSRTDAGRGDGPEFVIRYSPFEIPRLLSAARDRGVARAAEIARTQGPGLGWPMALAERYLVRCLTFKLDARHVEGANLFAEKCGRAEFVPPGAAIDWPPALRGAPLERAR